MLRCPHDHHFPVEKGPKLRSPFSSGIIADAVEKINDLNEVSATFESKELFVVPSCFIHTLFKVHALRDGHQELVKRVARKNGGLCPTAKLQQELHLAAMADGGIRAAEEFSEHNEALFGSRGRRREREGRGRVHVTEEGEANATEDNPSSTSGRGGKGRGRGNKGQSRGGGKGDKPAADQTRRLSGLSPV